MKCPNGGRCWTIEVSQSKDEGHGILRDHKKNTCLPSTSEQQNNSPTGKGMSPTKRDGFPARCQSGLTAERLEDAGH